MEKGGGRSESGRCAVVLQINLQTSVLNIFVLYLVIVNLSLLKVTPHKGRFDKNIEWSNQEKKNRIGKCV